MKKLVVGVAASVLMFSGVAFAGNQQNTGCGLGTIVFADAAFGDSTLGQVFIVTTNGTSGNQTFGITSGTSNCDQPSGIVKNERLSEFVVSNMDGLAKDIAAGEGEALDTLVELMEIAPDQKPEMYANLQSNFSNIYTSDSVTAATVVDNISTVIQ